MPNLTTKSHKSRKTGDGQAKPRQRILTETPVSVSPSPDEGTSSLVPATTASVAPNIIRSLEDAKNIIEAGTDTGVPAEKPREQQPWYRPADSKLRKQADKISVMRTAGHNGATIAKRLGTTEGNVRYVEYVARKNGWYDDEDQPVDIEAELTHSIDRKIVRNISASLDGQMSNWQTHEMTMAAAKGRGHFKNHDKVEGGPAVLAPVAIQIIMPALSADQQHVLDERNIGGVPAYVDGEVDHVDARQAITDGQTEPEPGPGAPVGAES